MSKTRSKIARNLAFNKVKKFTSNLMIFENNFCKYVTFWLQNKKNLCKIYYDKLNIDNFIFFMQIINFFYFERNFQYLQCSDLDKISHEGSPCCEVPPVKISFKSVNFKGGNNIFFLSWRYAQIFLSISRNRHFYSFGYKI